MAELEEESLALLREIIAAGRSPDGFPKPEVIQLRYKDKPWVLGDLEDAKLVATFASGIAPTVRGLRAAGTIEARDLEADVMAVADLIERLPRGVHVQMGQLGSRTGLKIYKVERALRILFASEMPYLGADETLSFIVPLGPDPFWARLRARSEPAHRAQISPIVLRATNFRALSRVDWTILSGVSLVAGANGVGKTSLLDVPALLRDLFEQGPAAAVGRQLGPEGMLRIGASSDQVSLGVGFGGLSWETRLTVTGSGLGEYPFEQLTEKDQIAVRRGALSANWYLRSERVTDPEPRAAFRAAWERVREPAWRPLVELIRGYRKYGSYDLGLIRRGGAFAADNTRLTDNGENLIAVLRNWKGAEVRFEHRFEWVLGKLREAFPGLVETLEFREPQGNIIPAYFYPPGQSVPLPLHRAADGLLVGLLHLTAVAGCPDGGLIAIDELENQLHPHAIRTLIAAFRERAESREQSILLTSHSPVVMNEFKDVPDRFFVLEPGREPLPVALDALHDRDWLALFELGELYVQNKFAAPRASNKS